MAPVSIDVDYYKLLEVAETDTTEIITKSYKRLALLNHPDRNKNENATALFQQISSAYETLKDDEKRREYDRIYPRIRKASNGFPTSAAQSPRSPPSTANPKPYDLSREKAEILAILKAQKERAEEWSKTQKVLGDNIFSLKREVRNLQNSIKSLEEIERAEKDEEEAAKSWKSWFLSPIYHKPVETAEENDSKIRERLQRLHNKDFKKMNLNKLEAQLRESENRVRSKREEFDNANRKDSISKSNAEAQIRMKVEREQREKERIAREAREKAELERRKQQQERDKAAREAREKGAAERRRKQQADEMSKKKAKELCRHKGWWEKVQGRIACEKCLASHYGFLLECPACKMIACAACQAQLQGRPNNKRTKPSHTSSNRGTGFHYFDDDYD